MAGDNILTAVSVARECTIIGRHQRVIQVQATPPTATASAKIEWICHELPGLGDEETDEDVIYEVCRYAYVLVGMR